MVELLYAVCFAAGVQTIASKVSKHALEIFHKKSSRTPNEEKEEETEEMKNLKEVKNSKIREFESWMKSFCDSEGLAFSKASPTRFYIDGIRVDMKFKLLNKNDLKVIIVTDDDLCDRIASAMNEDPTMDLIGEVTDTEVA